MKTLLKATHILKLFGTSKTRWTIQEIIDELGFHKSSVQRIVSALEKDGFLTSSGGRNRQYRLGLQLFILGSVATREMDLATIAKPALEQLVRDTQETAHLCIVESNQCLYIAKVACDRSIRVASSVGARLPLHCTGVGKALLSGMSEEAVDRIILSQGLPKFTENTIVSREALFAELERIRGQDFALDNEEFEIGLRCVAAPIFGLDKKVVASVSISGPANRISDQNLSMYSKYVIAAAKRISDLHRNERS